MQLERAYCVLFVPLNFAFSMKETEQPYDYIINSAKN